MNTMSRDQKLKIALSACFILTSAGAISVTAQTQTAVGTYTTSTISRPDSTTEPKESEPTKLPAATSENTPPNNAASVNREKDPSVMRATAPRPTTEPRSETGTAPRNPQAADDDSWQFQFSPYFWLAGLHGTGGVGNRTTNVDESFSDVFDALNFAFMGMFEARKGKFISLTDLEYVSVSDEKATPGPLFSTVDAGFKTFIFDQEVGYRLLEDPAKGASLDVVGGARVWRVKTDFEFGAGILPAVRIEGSRSWVDAVGGLRGKMALSEKVFLTGKFDLGGGDSDFTWQVFAGGGYNINPKIALIFGYRVLDVDYNENNFVYDMNQRGPIVGLGFRF